MNILINWIIPILPHTHTQKKKKSIKIYAFNIYMFNYARWKI